MTSRSGTWYAGEPCGPGLSDLELQNPSVGLIHGCPALAGTVGTSLRIWDILTGRLIKATTLPDTPIATAVGPKSTAWAIITTGYVGKPTVIPAEIHPAAARHHPRTSRSLAVSETVRDGRTDVRVASARPTFYLSDASDLSNSLAEASGPRRCNRAEDQLMELLPQPGYTRYHLKCATPYGP